MSHIFYMDMASVFDHSALFNLGISAADESARGGLALEAGCLSNRCFDIKVL